MQRRSSHKNLNPEDTRKEMNIYWKTTIISELHEALVEVCKLKPENPQRWLGEWLLKKSDEHRMVKSVTKPAVSMSLLGVDEIRGEHTERKPSAPTNVRVEGDVVTWTASADSGGAEIHSYDIETFPHPPDDSWEIAKTTWNVQRCRAKLPSALHADGKEYWIRVCAINEIGQGPYSEEVSWVKQPEPEDEEDQ
jgi:hypothetical protein